MAEDKKKYLDYAGLKVYDTEIKKLFKSEDDAILTQVENKYAPKSDLIWGVLGEEE